MAYVERSDEELFAAWEQKCNQEPKADEPSVVIGGIPYTTREALEKAKSKKHPFYRIMVKMIRDEAQKDDCDPLDYFKKTPNS